MYMILFQYNLLVLHFIILNHCFIAWEKKNVVLFPSCSQWAFLIVLLVTLALSQFSRAIKAHVIETMRSVPSGSSTHVTQWETSWEHYITRGGSYFLDK